MLCLLACWGLLTRRLKATGRPGTKMANSGEKDSVIVYGLASCLVLVMAFVVVYFLTQQDHTVSWQMHDQ